jgi:protein ImuB
MFAALHIPDFPVVAALRGRPGLSAVACAVLAAGEDEGGKLSLLAVNSAARVAGLARGWALSRALVRCPELQVLARDSEAEAALRRDLIGLGEGLAPDFEVVAEDAVLLDVSGRSLAVVLAGLEDLFLKGHEIWHARAATPDLAYLGARHELTQGREISPADLAPLPSGILSALGAGRGELKLLGLWGVRTLGDFMNLPRQSLVERLGPGVGAWHDLLTGKRCRVLRLHRPSECFAESLDFEYPVAALEPLLFGLRRLLHVLAGRLVERHLAVGRLELCLVHESGSELRRQLSLPDPQISVDGMLSPLRAMLESLRLEASVSRLELEVETTFATAAQREWFGRQLPQPERWVETLAKLEALLGSGRVGIPVPADTHQPDDFTLRPAVAWVGGLLEGEGKVECPLPLHRFRPARQVAVAFETRERWPWPMALLNGPHVGEIVGRRGPFPASGNWWESGGGWQRLEWDIELVSRQLLRLVFQSPDQWLLDGVYR